MTNHIYLCTKNYVTIATRDGLSLFWTFLFPQIVLALFVDVFGDQYRTDEVGRNGASMLGGGVIAITVMSSGFFGVGTAVVAMRSRGTLRRYRFLPITPSVIIVSTVLRNFILTWVSIGLLILALKFAYKVKDIGDVVSLLCVTSAGILAFCSLGFLVCGISKSTQASITIGNSFFYPMMFLSGASVPTWFLPDWLQTVSRFIPTTYIVSGLHEAMYMGHGLSSVLNQIGVLLVVTVLAGGLATRFFRWS